MYMYRNILVPLDGSRFAEHALPLALGVARRSGARLLLAHVRPADAVEGLSAFYPMVGGAAEASRSYLARVTERVTATVAPASVPVPVDPVSLQGPVAAALHERAVASGTDLVVMATHGHGPLSRLWLGSVADELVRRLPMPLLLVRPGDLDVDLSPETTVGQVLVPLDGSPRAESILEPATALGALWEAQYVLARVIPPVPILGLDLGGYAAGGLDLAETEYRQADAHAYLEGVAERLRSRSLRVRTSVVVDKHPVRGILDAAQSHGADLIALSTRGRGGLKRLLLGSVADKVIRAATTPVLVCRPPNQKAR
jgi:nucleotide-binding universal stress UspA family protein